MATTHPRWGTTRCVRVQMETSAKRILIESRPPQVFILIYTLYILNADLR